MKSENKILVTQAELYEFETSSRRRNKIRGFWKNIMHSLPRQLHQEVITKPANLVKTNQGLRNEVIYQFEIGGGSTELQNTVNKYVVCVSRKE